MAKKKDETIFAKMERPGPWPDPPERAPKADWNGRKFRKLPVVVEAVQIGVPLTLETLEGTMRGNIGDWLITGVKGEKYFCQDEIFRMTYEPVAEAEPEAESNS